MGEPAWIKCCDPSGGIRFAGCLAESAMWMGKLDHLGRHPVGNALRDSGVPQQPEGNGALDEGRENTTDFFSRA